MILAIDVFYDNNNKKAKTVGFYFSNKDSLPHKVFISYTENVEDYIAGKFYKRELPCILKILEDVNLYEISTILVDGYVYVDNDRDLGLGGILFEKLERKIPVIGVAKNPLIKNNETVQKIYRGLSKKPLFISSIGIDIEYAAELVKNLPGKHRILDILKRLDICTKE